MKILIFVISLFALLTPFSIANPIQSLASFVRKNSIIEFSEEPILSYLKSLSYFCYGNESFSSYVEFKKDLLKVNYQPSDIGSPRIRFSCSSVRAYDHATLKFKVMFGKEFDWAKGGKLNGFGSLYPRTGGRITNHNDWSVRFSFHRGGRLGVYIYQIERQGWGEMFFVPGFSFHKERWYDLELSADLNIGNNNDKIIVKINNVAVLNLENLNLKNHDNTGVQTFLFQTFYGGNNSSFSPQKDNKPLTTTAYFKEISFLTFND
ncbi:hypothetical protein Q4520_08350 [Alteromonas sp. 1_MG-2023]|uniref:polysaccharide lyase n=1 Tax=Alteromonas sp. 1_MG-2023 TaxID=3062669 RepID=UPI0026E2E801|nr:hypothetical protein [Alteromonas sp. 1_MG-2023]MDO6475429.1 hypothetical protein [Alteromonas sp. 1_MG-2023]